MLKVPAHIYIDDGLWGQRGGSLNTTKMFTYNRPNLFYIPSTCLKASGEVMRKIIGDQRRLLAESDDGHFCIFLISSEVELLDHPKHRALHANGLIAKLNKDGTITCMLTNP